MTSNRNLLSSIGLAPHDRLAPARTAVAPVTLRELPRVAALQRRAFRPPLAYGLMTLIVLWVLPNVRFLVARNSGAIIGCAIGDHQGGQSRVINICVDPSARRCGVATTLLRELERDLPAGDVVLMVEDSNAGAQALYRQEGYLSVGVSRDYYGRGKDGVWMQKHRTPNAPPKIRV